MEYADTNQRMRVACGRWQHARHCRASSCPLPWCRGLKCRLQADASSSEVPIIVDGQNYGPFHQVLPTENAYIMSVCRRQENVCVDQEGDGDDQDNNGDENNHPGPSPGSPVENLTHHRKGAEDKTVQNNTNHYRVPLRKRP